MDRRGRGKRPRDDDVDRAASEPFSPASFDWEVREVDTSDPLPVVVVAPLRATRIDDSAPRANPLPASRRRRPCFAVLTPFASSRRAGARGRARSRVSHERGRVPPRDPRGDRASRFRPEARVVPRARAPTPGTHPRARVSRPRARHPRPPRPRPQGQRARVGRAPRVSLARGSRPPPPRRARRVREHVARVRRFPPEASAREDRGHGQSQGEPSHRRRDGRHRRLGPRAPRHARRRRHRLRKIHAGAAVSDSSGVRARRVHATSPRRRRRARAPRRARDAHRTRRRRRAPDPLRLHRLARHQVRLPHRGHAVAKISRRPRPRRLARRRRRRRGARASRGRRPPPRTPPRRPRAKTHLQTRHHVRHDEPRTLRAVFRRVSRRRGARQNVPGGDRLSPPPEAAARRRPRHRSSHRSRSRRRSRRRSPRPSAVPFAVTAHRRQVPSRPTRRPFDFFTRRGGDRVRRRSDSNLREFGPVPPLDRPPAARRPRRGGTGPRVRRRAGRRAKGDPLHQRRRDVRHRRRRSIRRRLG